MLCTVLSSREVTGSNWTRRGHGGNATQVYSFNQGTSVDSMKGTQCHVARGVLLYSMESEETSPRKWHLSWDLKDEYESNRWDSKCFRQRGHLETGRCKASLRTWEEVIVAGVSERGEGPVRWGQRGRQGSAHAGVGSHVKNFIFILTGMGSH